MMKKTEDLLLIQAFSKFIKSKAGHMLFDASTDMWMNGPDYIAEEYRIEKKTGK